MAEQQQVKNKAVINITPTFLLKKIDPRKVLENYRNGKYSTVKLPEKKIQMTVVAAKISRTYGTTPDADVYTFRNKNNVLQTVATTNHNAYAAFNANGALPMGGICDWCRRSFTTQAIGIPILLEKIISPMLAGGQGVVPVLAGGNEVSPVVNLETGGTANYREVKIYHCDNPVYHSFNCALAALKKSNRLNWQFRDPLHMDSETMLRNFHAQVYPNAGVLKAARDYLLLKCHNGPLEDEEWDSGHWTFTRTSNIVVAPVKVQYHRS